MTTIYTTANEYRVTKLREVPVSQTVCDTPSKVANYWFEAIASDPRHNAEAENVVVLFLNTRNRVTGHVLLTVGTLNQSLIHPREVFRAAVIANANTVVLMHNHPSGDTSPSDADVRVTRKLREAGKLLEIELLDHVIVGNKPTEVTSLRELGYII